MALPRGFKADAERRVGALRAAIRADPQKPLDLTAVAGEVGASVIAADELVDIERLREIERIQAYAFSACTFDVKGRHVVVFNPLRSIERRASDIAHELAHIILQHDLSEVQFIGDVPFRTCLPDQEEQATALGGALLLPRSLLLSAARDGEDWIALARRLQVTEDMARFRWNSTGVARQVESASRGRKQ